MLVLPLAQDVPSHGLDLEGPGSVGVWKPLSVHDLSHFLCRYSLFCVHILPPLKIFLNAAPFLSPFLSLKAKTFERGVSV